MVCLLTSCYERALKPLSLWQKELTALLRRRGRSQFVGGSLSLI